MHVNQLSDAVPMAIDNIACGAAAVVAVQRGGTLQADGQVAGLTEKPQLLSRVQGAEDRPDQTTTSLQLLQSLNGVRCCSLLPSEDTQTYEHIFKSEHRSGFPRMSATVCADSVSVLVHRMAQNQS